MSIQWRAAEEAQNGHRSNQQPSNRQGTKWCSVSRKPRRQRALHASRAAESTLVRKHGQPTNRAPRPAAEKPVSSMRTKLTLKQACFQGYPESTVYVQIPVGSRNSASRNAYHTSLRPSSLFEPRHPSLKVVQNHCIRGQPLTISCGWKCKSSMEFGSKAREQKTVRSRPAALEFLRAGIDAISTRPQTLTEGCAQ